MPTILLCTTPVRNTAVPVGSGGDARSSAVVFSFSQKDAICHVDKRVGRRKRRLAHGGDVGVLGLAWWLVCECGCV